MTPFSSIYMDPQFLPMVSLDQYAKDLWAVVWDRRISRHTKAIHIGRFGAK